LIDHEEALAMRALLAALTAAVVLGGPALAQQTRTQNTPMNPSPGVSSQNGPGNPAVDTKSAADPETTGAVEAGANSFT
jgi:periplasmic protein CpxP/Spy